MNELIGMAAASVAMRLKVEGKPETLDPTEPKVRKAIASLRSYGPSSYASLTDSFGNYVQVGKVAQQGPGGYAELHALLSIFLGQCWNRPFQRHDPVLEGSS
ncbi:hypothetical protein PSP6_260080 [Paraburkholderia tropica]|nr:hypothetical protein PSP6_260080 [Paraburkholderia tropica]